MSRAVFRGFRRTRLAASYVYVQAAYLPFDPENMPPVQSRPWGPGEQEAYATRIEQERAATVGAVVLARAALERLPPAVEAAPMLPMELLVGGRCGEPVAFPEDVNEEPAGAV